MDLKFRKLKADEIEIRAQSVTAGGVILLLYKNSRTDMDILDETVGKNNWRRSHILINGNLFCNVEIWDVDKKNGFLSKMLEQNPIQRRKRDKLQIALRELVSIGESEGNYTVLHSYG